MISCTPFRLCFFSKLMHQGTVGMFLELHFCLLSPMMWRALSTGESIPLVSAASKFDSVKRAISAVEEIPDFYAVDSVGKNFSFYIDLYVNIHDFLFLTNFCFKCQYYLLSYSRPRSAGQFRRSLGMAKQVSFHSPTTNTCKYFWNYKIYVLYI